MLKKLDSFMEVYAFSHANPVLLLKHSPISEESVKAKNNLDTFAKQKNITSYVLFVQDQRSLSNEVESKTGIKHEDPQLILFRNGRPVGYLSKSITLEDIEDLWKKTS